MSERDELLDVILDADKTSAGPTVFTVWDHMTDAIIAEGYRKPRTITTTEDLDALPDRSIVSAATTETYVAIKRMDGKNWWLKAGSDAPHSSGQIAFPAIAHYEPTA